MQWEDTNVPKTNWSSARANNPALAPYLRLRRRHDQPARAQKRHDGDAAEGAQNAHARGASSQRMMDEIAKPGLSSAPKLTRVDARAVDMTVIFESLAIG